MRDSHVADYMEDIFVSEKVALTSRIVNFFEQALRTLGIENGRHVLVVGDSLGGDIKGGINAGLATCWFNPGRTEKHHRYQTGL